MLTLQITAKGSFYKLEIIKKKLFDTFNGMLAHVK